MTKRTKRNGNAQVGDYRHNRAKRKNNPPAGMAPNYEVRERKQTNYAYDPHLDPQLVWAGKAEHTSFSVDEVSLHIHERVSTRAILEAVRKPEPQLSLFGNDTLSADKQIEFYQHDVNWANRLILGDSLLVMNSLLVKEGMAGKVQCIYIDPPYGINYKSNFQSRIDRRDVKERDNDLSREPEQIRAYRDTWKLGIHSYLSYLRDRLMLAKDLLTESGSVFVQINDENLHLVRTIMDEVFGRENAVGLIGFKKTGGATSEVLPAVFDYIAWYSRSRSSIRYRDLYLDKTPQEIVSYRNLELRDGSERDISDEELAGTKKLPEGARLYQSAPLTSSGFRERTTVPFEFQGKTWHPGSNANWKTTTDGLSRLVLAERIIPKGSVLNYKRYLSDFPVLQLDNYWDDVGIGYAADERFYVVQTQVRAIERCVLMTTDPGDLVFDPTGGSGTTAFCAEKWGRRWITCDTSRVAVAIARQRLLTAKYDYYELRDSGRGPAGGFNYETVPHIMLESVAKNPEIDPVADKYQPQIDEALRGLNTMLGKRLKEWEVPRKADADWTKTAQEAHREFWSLKQQKRREIDATVQRNAPQETLYDKPLKRPGTVRVTGPFTVEAIPVPILQDPAETPIPQFETEEVRARVDDRAGDYLADMMDLLKQQGGVLFPGGKKMALENLRVLNLGMLHAEAETPRNGKDSPSPQPSPVQGRGGSVPLKVAISFGPKHGPITATQVEEAIPIAKRNAYDILVLAGFSFEAEAHSFIQKAKETVRGLTIQAVNIAPDVLVGDLLKTSRASQIFTAFGQPDIAISSEKDGTFRAVLRGVDIYDPLTGEVKSTPGKDVKAWFLDTDYDNMTFHISQAFFPGDEDAWDKLQRALKVQIDPEAFEQMRGTESFPFKPGKHKRIAVKVIDFRGNEVMKVMGVGDRERRRNLEEDDETKD